MEESTLILIGSVDDRNIPLVEGIKVRSKVSPKNKQNTRQRGKESKKVRLEEDDQREMEDERRERGRDERRSSKRREISEFIVFYVLRLSESTTFFFFAGVAGV